MFWFNFLLLLQCPNSKELHFPKLLKVIQFWISFWQFHSSYLKNCSKILKLFRFGSLYHYVPSHTSPKHPLPKDSLSRNLVRGISANEVGGCLHKDCTVEVKFHKVSAIGKGCKEKKKGHYGGDEQTNEYRLKSTQCGNFENISTAQFLREINFAYKYVPFCTMGCFIVYWLRNSEMLPNWSGSIDIMKTKPNQLKMIRKSEKKVLPMVGFEPMPFRVKGNGLVP